MKKLFINAVLFFYASFAGVSFAAINLNTATQTELESVRGIGTKKAQAIITYRAQHQGFKSVEDLKEIKGIGDGKTFNNLKKEFFVETKNSSPIIKLPAQQESIQAAKKAGTTPAAKVIKEEIKNPLAIGSSNINSPKEDKKKVLGQ